MKHLFLPVFVLSVWTAGTALAAGGYNDAPWGDPQVVRCMSKAMSSYSGGTDPSKVAGQTKAQAWCECMWNETPEDFEGDLVRFSESSKGASINKKCERHSGWD